MLLSFASHLLGAWFAFALPAIATYKAIAHNPDQLSDLAKYWVVLGLFTALEQAFGFVLGWLPFYWEVRTIFLLYIALPQTQGSTYVYTTLVHPWLSKNEEDIDAAITAAQSNAFAFARARIAALIDLVNNTQHSTDAQNPAQSRVDQLKGLWDAYAPSALVALRTNGSGDVHANGTAKDIPQSY